MFDKMHLKTAENFNEDRLSKLGFRSIPGDGQYKRRHLLEASNGQSLTLKTCPYYSNAQNSIELNPSRFTSWQDVKLIMSEFVDLNSCLIDRLDHAVDIETPFERVREVIRIKRKQTIERFKEFEHSKSKIHTGIKAGEKPEIFCIYDKGLQVTNRFKFKSIPGARRGVLTRFEVRHYANRVPFSKLSQIENYLEINPFEKIESYELRSDIEASDKVLRLRRDIQLVGFDGIYHELNGSGNFNRTWGKYFEKKPLDNELREIYQSNCRKFLGA